MNERYRFACTHLMSCYDTGHHSAGWTSAVTLGFLLGLQKGNRFSKMKEPLEQKRMLQRNYASAIVSLLGLVLCPLLPKTLPSTFLAAVASSLLCWTAASVSFQFFQLPNLVSANMFAKEHASVSLSWIDAAGFFVTAPILAGTKIVLSRWGWSSAWGWLAGVFAVGSMVMMKSIDPVLEQAAKKRRRVVE